MAKAPTPEVDAGAGSRLPQSLSTELGFVWLTRPDVVGDAPACDEAGKRRFLAWWLIHGRHEYPHVAPLDPEQIATAFAPVPTHTNVDWPGLPAVATYLWREHDDLHRRFAGEREGDAAGLWHWFYTDAVRDFGLFDVLPPEHYAAVRQAADEIEPTEPLPVTRLMLWIWEARPDLQAAFPLARPEGRAGLVGWFYLLGAAELGLLPYIGAEERQILCGAADHGSGVRAVERLALALIGGDAADPDGVDRARGWLEDDPKALPLREFLAGSDVPAAAEPAPGFPPPTRRDGVNLLGFASGELGIGEDIRSAAAALAAAGVPFSVVPLPIRSSGRESDRTLAGHLGKDAPFAINLFCLTGFSTAECRLRLGDSLWQGRHTIGWWPWELPQWPPEWRAAFGLVDEVWAMSRHTEAAYRDDCPVPLVPMPPAIRHGAAGPIARGELGLAADAFVFVFVFDGNSYLDRKNPEAVVAAFARAFPRGSEPVALVIKAMNGPPGERWQALLASCTADARIRLIDETWDRGRVLGLIAACDAFVSLHRAEGFGRGLAEAMLLGKPVIATDFSGNTDFLGEATGFPVRYERRRVEKGAYPFAEGQSWAEPDLDHAAELMRWLAERPPEARIRAEAGRRLIEEMHSPKAVGERMRQRLRSLGLRSPAPSRPRALTRMLALEAGLSVLGIEVASSPRHRIAGLTVPAFLVSTAPPPLAAEVEFVGSPRNRCRWLAQPGDAVFVRAPEGGGAVLVTAYEHPDDPPFSADLTVTALG